LLGERLIIIALHIQRAEADAALRLWLASAVVQGLAADRRAARCGLSYKGRRVFSIDVWREVTYHEADWHRCGASRERAVAATS
jgi:hypothetical protein